MKRIVKIIMIIFIVFFLSLYFSRYNILYNDNKNVLTDESIKRFEKDLKSGKIINPKDYIEKEKDYSNKASVIGIKISKIIEISFKKGVKIIMKQLEQLE